MQRSSSYKHNNNKKRKKVKYSFHGKTLEIWNYYKPIKRIGVGGRNFVLEVKDKRFNGRTVVIKQIKDVFNDLKNAKQTLREIKLLMLFKQDDIIRLMDVIPPDQPNTLTFNNICLVMPIMQTTLKKIITSHQRLNNRHYLFFIYQILRGLKYIHSAGVIHADLKPEHILVNGSNCNIKITNFQHAILKKENIHYDRHGWYYAPEEILSTHNYTEKIDVWAVGCIFAELLLRRAMFQAPSNFERIPLIYNILGSPYCYQYTFDYIYSDFIVCGWIRNCWSSKMFNDVRLPSTEVIAMITSFHIYEITHSNLDWISKHAQLEWVQKLGCHKGHDLRKIFKNATPMAIDLIQQMLVVNPSKRISVHEALAHPYFSKLHHTKSEKTMDENTANNIQRSFRLIDECDDRSIRFLMHQTLHSFDNTIPRRGTLKHYR